jgi:hypothetical protein
MVKVYGLLCHLTGFPLDIRSFQLAFTGVFLAGGWPRNRVHTIVNP